MEKSTKRLRNSDGEIYGGSAKEFQTNLGKNPKGERDFGDRSYTLIKSFITGPVQLIMLCIIQRVFCGFVRILFKLQWILLKYRYAA